MGVLPPGGQDICDNGDRRSRWRHSTPDSLTAVSSRPRVTGYWCHRGDGCQETNFARAKTYFLGLIAIISSNHLWPRRRVCDGIIQFLGWGQANFIFYEFPWSMFWTGGSNKYLSQYFLITKNRALLLIARKPKLTWYAFLQTPI